jgi:hypothetical protein
MGEIDKRFPFGGLGFASGDGAITEFCASARQSCEGAFA